MTDINDVIKTIDELIDGGVLTQYAIAREAGISDGTLSAFRKGKYKGDNAAVAASLRSGMRTGINKAHCRNRRSLWKRRQSRAARTVSGGSSDGLY